MATPLPKHSAPFVDPKSGLINQQWYEFLDGFTRDLKRESEARAAAITALEDEIASGDGTVMLKDANLSDVADVSEAQGNIGMAWVRVSAGSAASGVSEIDIPLTGEYRAFDLLIHEIVVSSASAAVYLRLSLDGGSTYEAAAYNYATRQLSDTAGIVTGNSASAAQLFLFNSGSVAEEGMSGTVRLHMAAGHYPRAEVSGYGLIAGQGLHYKGGGALEVAGVPTHVRILLGAGTITSCTWTLMGLR